jgi:DNA-binding response OmpR family regulator
MLFGKREHRVSRLLVVEDEPLVAFDNEHLLRDAGYEVIATVDGVAAAIDVINAQPLDLVLVDIALSDGGSGIDVAQAARDRGVAVLFVTGNCPPESGALAIGCLAKPYTQRDLRGALEAIESRLRGEPVKRKPRALTLYPV